MCGRFLLEPRDPQVVRSFFDLAEDADLGARWNVAPTQEVPVLRLGSDGSRQFARLRWGLIPSWAKDAAMGQRMINARAETVAEKPSFRAAWKARRCLVPATGWYEWRQEGSRKQPWLLRRAGAAFTPMAGLWEEWKDPASARVLQSFTILTMAAEAALEDVHQRMPVVLEPGDFSRWLETPAERAAELKALLQPPAGRAWERFPVDARVNNPRMEGEACAAPLPLSP